MTETIFFKSGKINKNPRGNPHVIFGRGKHEEISEDFQIRESEN